MDTARMPSKKYPTSEANCSLTSGLFMANLPGLYAIRLFADGALYVDFAMWEFYLMALLKGVPPDNRQSIIHQLVSL